MAKQVESAGNSDRTGSLPDPILSHILSFLPIKDAIRTSVLSPRWRYLFNSMSTLDFTSCFFYSTNIVESFNNFVDRLLSSSNQQSLECVRFGQYGDYSRLHGWICATLSRGVKELDISGTPSAFPTHLFTSHTLVTLKLGMFRDMEIPTNFCLPKLKKLRLYGVYQFFTDADSFNRLISNCLVLEDLHITQPHCPHHIGKIMIHKLSFKRLILFFFDEIHENRARDFNYVVEINAPSLVHFGYTDPIAEGYTISTMTCLERADIKIHPFASYNVDRDPGAVHLLQAFGNVQSLSLRIDCAETLLGTSLKPLFAFHNLVKLEITNVDGNWIGRWIIKFLHCVPNLKKLILKLELGYKEGPQSGIWLVPNKVPSCLQSQLKEIEIPSYGGERDMFEIIRYFLRHARALEKLIVGFYSRFVVEEQRLTNIKRVLRLPRNKKKCQVVVL